MHKQRLNSLSYLQKYNLYKITQLLISHVIHNYVAKKWSLVKDLTTFNLLSEISSD